LYFNGKFSAVTELVTTINKLETCSLYRVKIQEFRYAESKRESLINSREQNTWLQHTIQETVYLGHRKPETFVPTVAHYQQYTYHYLQY